MKTLVLLSSALLLSCSNQKEAPKSRSYASTLSELPAPELGEVWGSEQEKQAEGILDDTLEMLKKDSEGDAFVRRDAHPKTHACVRARFKVHPERLPKASRLGIFSTSESYDAWIRFSNGASNGESKPDIEKDVRGMAIKLMNVPGTPTGVHDFVMANMKEFFSKDGDDYVDLVKTASKGSRFDLAVFALTHPKSALILSRARIQLGNPLQQDFHSAVPYKLGDHSVRYHALPCDSSRDPIPGKDAPRDYLRTRLAESLSRKPACFTFAVQLNNSPKTQPVEDPRMAWDEKASPIIPVADVEILKQSDVTNPDLLNFCENARFNPWHSKGENRPLGQINRIRALVYKEISRYRHEKNGVTELEPVSHSPCEGRTATLCRQP